MAVAQCRQGESGSIFTVFMQMSFMVDPLSNTVSEFQIVIMYTGTLDSVGA